VATLSGSALIMALSVLKRPEAAARR